MPHSIEFRPKESRKSVSLQKKYLISFREAVEESLLLQTIDFVLETSILGRNFGQLVLQFTDLVLVDQRD